MLGRKHFAPDPPLRFHPATSATQDSSTGCLYFSTSTVKAAVSPLLDAEHQGGIGVEFGGHDRFRSTPETAQGCGAMEISSMWPCGNTTRRCSSAVAGIQFRSGTPADVMMFLDRQRGRPASRPRPIDHPDVLVGGADAMDVEKARVDQRPGAGSVVGGRSPSSSTSRPLSSLVSRNAACSGVFVQFDVPAERQPLVEFTMVDQQHLPVLDHEDGDGEINFVVNVAYPCLERRPVSSRPEPKAQTPAGRLDRVASMGRSPAQYHPNEYVGSSGKYAIVQTSMIKNIHLGPSCVVVQFATGIFSHWRGGRRRSSSPPARKSSPR